MAGATITVTDATFDAEVLKSDKPVLVDFWATWCGPCRQVAPILEEIAAEHSDKLTIAKLDVDNNQQTAAAYNVISIPTLNVYQNGELVKTITGARPKAALLNPNLTSAFDTWFDIACAVKPVRRFPSIGVAFDALAIALGEPDVATATARISQAFVDVGVMETLPGSPEAARRATPHTIASRITMLLSIHGANFPISVAAYWSGERSDAVAMTSRQPLLGRCLLADEHFAPALPTCGPRELCRQAFAAIAVVPSMPSPAALPP